MNYPDNFETPAFPAGTRIASARAVAICTAISFLVIVFLCLILVWARGSIRKHPFLVSVGYNGIGEWTVVGHDHGRRTISAARAMQEALVGKYIRARFAISGSAIENEGAWAACNRTTDCASIGNSMARSGCTLYCAGTDEVFDKFVTKVVPDYRARAAVGERWTVDASSMQIRPSSVINNDGGMWRAIFTLVSNMNASITVVAYVKIARNAKEYPGTLGFYVADFNAYRWEL